ncbi:MAG: hypothetical protein HPZ91_00440 [Lentisphaeria bacterium]|nr:hypothetical protein [Lentisphaeria bacterium]
MKPLILVLGANPAWQKSLFFAGLHPGAVNRAERRDSYPGGKGVNFCRAAACFGKAEALLFQFAGGLNGERLRRAMDAEGIRHETVETAAETRCCITCLNRADKSMTELIEPSGKVSEAEAEELLSRLSARMPKAALFAIAGSLPDGTDLSFYERAAAIAVKAGVPVLADAVRGIAPVLALPGRIILKVNGEEFLRITGCTELREAHRAAAGRWRNAQFAVTAGAGSATFSDRIRVCRYTNPKLAVVNPLGAGDTASAVLSSCLAAGSEPAEAFRTALAAASANCLTDRAGSFLSGAMEEILPQIRCTEWFSLVSTR